MQKIWMAAAVALWALPAFADLALHGLFTDNMVLQKEVAVPVWGRTDPGEKVTVCVAGQSVSSVVDETGRWRVKLRPMKADGRSLTLTVSDKNNITVKNVLVGEVWLGSGQSNMQMALRNANNAPAEMAAAIAKAEGKRPPGHKPAMIGPDIKNRPGGLYNAMIHPLLGYGIRESFGTRANTILFGVQAPRLQGVHFLMSLCIT
jgi:hypothetical protein